jgi:hypothetical protein
MSGQEQVGVQIGRDHIKAICAEIGERLPAALRGSPARLPPHLLRLMELLDSLEGRDAPSIGPRLI